MENTVKFKTECLKVQKNISLHIYGDGPLRAILKKQIDTLQLSSIVTLDGVSAHSTLMKKLADADLLVVPSIELENDIDGVPTVIAEAMAVKTPVLATSIAGIGEMIIDKETGFLVVSDNVEKLTQYIELLVKSAPMRNEVIPTAYAKVAEEYALNLAIELSETT